MPPPLINAYYPPNQPDSWPKVNPSAVPDQHSPGRYLPHPDGRVEPYYPNDDFGGIYNQPSTQFPYTQHFPIPSPLGPLQINHSSFNTGIDDPAPKLPQNNPAVPDVVESVNPEYWNPQWAGPYTPGPGFPQDKYGRPPWFGGVLPGPDHPGWDKHSPWSNKNSNPHTPNNPEPIKWINTDPPKVRKRLPSKDPLEGALTGGER